MKRIFTILKKYNYVLLFLALEVIAILMIIQQSYYQQSKILNWCNRVTGGIYSVSDGITHYFGLQRENETLVAENARLRQMIADSYISYDRKCFVHNDTTYKQTYHYITARVIKSSWNKPANYIMINKGLDHGIKPDMGVISPRGIVGVVVDASRNFATVMTVLHPESRNSVQLTRTKTNGTLIWNGMNFRFGTVIDIPTTYRLQYNDTLVTSGQDPTFPKGIMVGFIEQSKSNPSGFYDIQMRLSTEFNRLDYVYVVHNSFMPEIEALDAKIEKPEPQK